MDRKRHSCLLDAAIIILLSSLMPWPAHVFGQGLPSAGGGRSDRIEGNIKLMPIPYVNYNRSFGYQVGALPMVLFNPVKSDTLSPSSLAGVVALYSENKTWFLMGFSMLHLDEDKWRVMAAGGYGSVNFQFFLDTPIDSWIPYNTKMEMFLAQGQRRILNGVYAGAGFIHLHLKTTTDEIPRELNTKLNGMILELSMDGRSNVRYPRSGYLADLKYLSYPKFFGNEKASNKIEIAHNHYFPARKNNDIVAGRFYAGLGLSDLSFEQQLIVGRTDIRGYTQGAFRGNYLLAVQGEYRWNFFGRFGAVGFGGLATVFEAINEKDDGKLLPGIGAGFRYAVDTKTNMNAGMDLAFGIDDWGIYFRIGEAF